jgi:hypothetical protein
MASPEKWLVIGIVIGFVTGLMYMSGHPVARLCLPVC